MVMRPGMVLDIAHDLVQESAGVQAGLDRVDRWLSTDNPIEVFRKAHTPEKVSREKRELQKLAYTPILELIVSELAQQMIVDQVVVPGDDEAGRRMFAPWDANGMPSKQYGLWRSAFGYGQAHLLVLPSATVHPMEAVHGAAMMPFSPRQMYVSWNDPVEDEFPAFALRLVGKTGEWHGLRLYDEEAVHYIQRDKETGELTYVEAREHGMGVVPVVTFSNGVDLEGRSPGEVDKYRVVAERHNKTTADRLLAQHYNSWKVRYATGLDLTGEPDPDGYKQKLAHEDILTGGEGVQFGTLPETQLDGLLKAAEADRDALAAVSQTPVWALNGGQLINLSAEALIEARSMQKLKVGQKQRSNGVVVARALRLAAFAEHRWDDADRFDLQTRWVDVEARSLAAVADGLQKLNAMGVPPELLIEMIPGLSSGTVSEWRAHMAGVMSGPDRLASVLERQLAGGEH